MKKMIIGLLLICPMWLKAQDTLFSRLKRATVEELAQYIKTHSDDDKSMRVLRKVFIHKPQLSTDELSTYISIYNTLSPSLQQTTEGKNFSELLNKRKGLVTGATLPDFTSKDTAGKPVRLYDYRGKYVLVDFWASWCVPCRKEFPYLKKAYARFKDKHFEIIGYSIDDKEALWLSAIKDDATPWIQVSNLQGIKDPVAALYDITSVPQNWLIDPSGKVIAKDLRGEQVEKQLEALIK